MNEENRRQAEGVHRALGEFLDRLAEAIVAGLGPSEQANDATGRRSANPKKAGTKRVKEASPIPVIPHLRRTSRAPTRHNPTRHHHP